MGHEGDAAKDLDSLTEQKPADLRMEPLDFGPARNEDLARVNCVARRKTFERNGKFGFRDRRGHRQVQRVDFQYASGAIEKREARVIVRDNGFERRDDALERSGDVARADQQIVYFEQHLQAIAFAGELFLISLCGFEVDRVIDCDRYLSRNPLHEIEFGIGHSLWNVPPETHCAEPMLRGGQRQDRDCVNTLTLHALHEFGVTRFLGRIERNKRLLVLPYPARWGGLN